ncbi:MAG: hypothetical protein A4S09_14185 [Proteobacteria bacterium SG_bin7]|nr:MAG: hypothetical protein A4S09_14185 [Proteobacteria bacterium SG_bin7]
MKGDFFSDLAFGKAIEKQLTRMLPGYTVNYHSNGEFDLSKGDINVEVKADRYYASKFLFIEKYGDKETKKPGGPFRAYEDDPNSELIYVVVNEYTSSITEVYIFKTTDLYLRCSELIESGEYLPIGKPNTTYTTIGYLIPKSEFLDIAIVIKPQESKIPKQKKAKTNLNYQEDDI